MAIIAQTDRFTIREYLAEDEEAFLTLVTDPLVTEFIPKRNRDENRKLFEDTLADSVKGVPFNRWGVFDRVSNTFIGHVMLKLSENEVNAAELGYVIHDAHKAKGVATEVAAALLAYGFAENKLTEIFAVTVKENTPSQRVLLKVGLLPGNDIFRNGLWLAYFKITAESWLKSQNTIAP